MSAPFWPFPTTVKGPTSEVKGPSIILEENRPVDAITET